MARMAHSKNSMKKIGTCCCEPRLAVSIPPPSSAQSGRSSHPENHFSRVLIDQVTNRHSQFQTLRLASAKRGAILVAFLPQGHEHCAIKEIAERGCSATSSTTTNRG